MSAIKSGTWVAGILLLFTTLVCLSTSAYADWRDYVLDVDISGVDIGDNSGSIGIMFRYIDADNFYRFQWDVENNTRQLVKREHGVFSVLAQDLDTYPFTYSQDYKIRITANQSLLSVSINNKNVLETNDDTFAIGGVGFFCFSDIRCYFDSFLASDLSGGSVLHQTNFSSDIVLNDITLVDEGNISGPSEWSVSGGLNQYAGIYRAGDNGINKQGTFALLNDSLVHKKYNAHWADYVVNAQVQSTSADAMGIMFRYQDSNNYYRFSWNHEGKRYLGKRVNGIFTVLAEDDAVFDDQKHDIDIIVSGPKITIHTDGQQAFSLTDTSFVDGGVAFYCYDNTSCYFDDVSVKNTDTNTTLYEANFDTSTTSLNDFIIVDEGGSLEASNWQVDGRLFQSTNMHLLNENSIDLRGTYALIRASTDEQVLVADVSSALMVGTDKTFQTIQEAINAANIYDLILIDSGTYDEVLDLHTLVHLKANSEIPGDVTLMYSGVDDVVATLSLSNERDTYLGTQLIEGITIESPSEQSWKTALAFQHLSNNLIVSHSKLSASNSNSYAMLPARYSGDGFSIRLIHSELSRGYAHIIYHNFGDLFIEKTQLDNTINYINSNKTAQIADYVTGTSENYGLQSGRWVIPLSDTESVSPDYGKLIVYAGGYDPYRSGIDDFGIEVTQIDIDRYLLHGTLSNFAQLFSNELYPGFYTDPLELPLLMDPLEILGLYFSDIQKVESVGTPTYLAYVSGYDLSGGGELTASITADDLAQISSSLFYAPLSDSITDISFLSPNWIQDLSAQEYVFTDTDSAVENGDVIAYGTGAYVLSDAEYERTTEGLRFYMNRGAATMVAMSHQPMAVSASGGDKTTKATYSFAESSWLANPDEAFDYDQDGVADSWEVEHGLDIENANDVDDGESSYTYFSWYLNSFVDLYGNIGTASSSDIYELYISTDDTQLGTFIGTADASNYDLGGFNFSIDLAEGQTHYLHVIATSSGANAGLIGSVSLNPDGFILFDKKYESLSGEPHWRVSETGFGENYETPISLGVNGTLPWGTVNDINSGAEWIWDTNACESCTRYFSLAIEPKQITYSFDSDSGHISLLLDNTDDIIVFLGELHHSSRISYYRVLDDLIFTTTISDDTLTIQNWFTDAPRYQVEQLEVAFLDSERVDVTVDGLYEHTEIPGLSDFEFFNNKVYVTWSNGFDTSKYSASLLNYNFSSLFNVDSDLPETTLSHAIQHHDGWLYYQGESDLYRYNGTDTEQLSLSTGEPGGELSFINDYVFTGNSNETEGGNRWYGVSTSEEFALAYTWTDQGLYGDAQTIALGRGSQVLRFNNELYFTGQLYGSSSSDAGGRPPIYTSENNDPSTAPTNITHIDIGIDNLAPSPDPLVPVGQTNGNSLVFTVGNTEHYSFTTDGQSWLAAQLPVGYVFVNDAGLRTDAKGQYYALVKNSTVTDSDFINSYFVFRLNDDEGTFTQVVTLSSHNDLSQDSSATAIDWKELRIVDNTLTIGGQVDADIDYVVFQQVELENTALNEDVTPPDPVSFTAEALDGGTSIQLDWTDYYETVNGGDIDGYTIYISTSDFSSAEGQAAINLRSNDRNYIIEGLTNSTAYYLAVAAYDDDGNINNTSLTTTRVTTIDTQAPDSVSGLRATATQAGVTLTWEPSTDGDIAMYHVVVDGITYPVAADLTSYTFSDLTAATSYAIYVSAVDHTGNISDRVFITVVTLLDNPSISSTESFNGMVELLWEAVEPTDLLSQYQVYVSQEDFVDVTNMTPSATVNASQTSARIAGLTNGTTYYFAVASENATGGINSVVNTASAVPFADTEGPVISTFSFNDLSLTGDIDISTSGIFSVAAVDPIGVGRVEFTLNGDVFATDFDGSNGYAAPWSITDINNGIYTIGVVAYDTLDNVSRVDIDVNIAIAVPPAPTITAPITGYTTNSRSVTVSGASAAGSTVSFYRDGDRVAGPVNLAADLRFSDNVSLAEGENIITAVATNRGGDSVPSTAIAITLDTTLPGIPTSLSASTVEGGEVNVSWRIEDASSVVAYNLYRSEVDFTDAGMATRLNNSPLTSLGYTDIPFTDGTYFYAVESLNSLGTASALSNRASVLVDSTPPKITNITYTHLGNFDAANERFGTGSVDVVVDISEELLTTPFLSIVPEGGFPVSIDLFRRAANDDTIQYAGQFEISATTPSGLASAVFSARDLNGNRGTEIDQGQVINIDASGPVITSLQVSPTHPIQNDTANPVTLTMDVTMSEAAVDVPSVFYQLSGSGRDEVEITDILPGDNETRWLASVTLPNDAGLLEAELLQLRFEARDDLGNLGTDIEGRSAYQVYQGDLPPVDFPIGLQASALPGGQISLSWFAVDEAEDYQLYRQAPSETELSPIQTSDGELTLIDQTDEDGEHLYAIASIREENGETSLSAHGASVAVTALSVLPNAPTELTLSLLGGGVAAQWNAPQEVTEGESIHYRLYRSDQTDILSVEGLTPIIDDIYSVQALDTNPLPNEHAYAVTTVDRAGNESAPSESMYLNFELLPVNPLSVMQTDNEAPQLSWSHASATVVAYDIYLGTSDSGIKLTDDRLDTPNYSDEAYSGDERIYSIVPIDTGDVSGPERSVLLPRVSVTLLPEATLNRGVMNRLSYTVSNGGNTALTQVLLRVKVEGYDHVSEAFNLDAGQTETVDVIVGGYEDLPAIASLQTDLEISPNASEMVIIRRNQDIDVSDSALLLSLSTQSFTRGGTGQVQFTLENTSDVDIEVITAMSNGTAASDDIRFALLDEDNNTLASQSYLRYTGVAQSDAVIITLANRLTVARIPAGGSFTSEWVDIAVPASAPDNMTLEMAIDAIHYQQGTDEHVAIEGVTTTRDVSVVDTSYTATITSITPVSSHGDQDIIITGQASDRATGAPLDFAPVSLVLTVNGFERVFSVYSNQAGEFSYTFTPLEGEAGIYRVSAVHPDILDRPESGEFTISRVTVSPPVFNVTIPYNYEREIPLTLSAGDGTTATNTHFVLDASLQDSGSLPAGINVNIPAPINLSSKAQERVTLTITADATADAVGSLVLALRSDESGDDNLALVTMGYVFSDAEPALHVSPNFIETGVVQGDSVNETAVIENRGLATLQNVRLELLDATGAAAPAWAYLDINGELGDLEVGDSQEVTVNINPADSLSDGIYSFVLRITSDNAATYDMPLFASVTQSGMGNILFHIADIYTATQDDSGELIRGVEQAKIYLQNEDVYTVDTTVYTDGFGEALIDDLPAGTYRYRISASNHEEAVGRIRILPGITATQEVFLDYNLVTVEWSVREIVIEDRYEIVLNATFETDVPAAVVVASPISLTLPDMKPGDVFYGEIVLTNHGLIRADDFNFSMPANDAYFSFEVMNGVPDSIEAKEQVRIPFRMVAINSLDPEFDGSGGAGCYNYNANTAYDYAYECANGTTANGAGGTGFYATGDSNNCGVTNTAPSVPVFGGGGGGGSGGGAGVSLSVQQADQISGLPACRPETEDMCSTGNGE